MKKLIPMPSFNAVGAGQTANIDLPTVDRYDQLRLFYGTGAAGGPTQANMEAHINEIRLNVNGKTQRRFSAADLFKLNAYHGIAVVDGLLPIFFAEPWRRTAQGEDALGWGMGDVRTFQVEVDLDAAANAPTLKATALKTPSNDPMDVIIKWRKFSIGVTAAGERNLTDLPDQDAYYAMHFLTGDIDKAKVLLDQEEIVNADVVDLHEVATQNGFTPQTGVVHVDFANTGRVADALPMRAGDGSRVRDFRVDLNMTAATSHTLITETLGRRD